MRREPEFIHRVARIATAEMVIDAAFRHMVERAGNVCGEVFAPHAQMDAPEQGEKGHLRKFWRAVYAAILRVHDVGELAGNGAKHSGRRLAGTRCFCLCLKRVHKRGPVLENLGRFLMEDARHFAQHIGEARPSIGGFLREVGAAPERLAIGR